MSTSESDSECPLSFTSILFGNIGQDGKLEGDYLDEDSKKNLHALSTLANLVNDELDLELRQSCATGKDDNYDDNDNDDKDDQDKNENSSDEKEGISATKPYNSPIDFDDDDSLADDEDESYTTANFNNSSAHQPSAEPSLHSDQQNVNGRDNETNKNPLAKNQNEHINSRATNDQLNTPLAAILPSKYKGCDVTELFPGFKHNKVLRFSRLFGPGKQSSLPQIWNCVKSKTVPFSLSQQQSSHQTASSVNNNKEKDTKVESKEKNLQETNGNKTIESSQTTVQPPPEIDQSKYDQYLDYEIDDEEILLRATQSNQCDLDGDKTNPNRIDRSADWRYGPAQYWYDYYKVPEDTPSYDYGFKPKRKESPPHVDEDPKDPDDSFHMICQLQWEDDVIWDGHDEESKILAKIGKKCHAAGWVPSAMHRKASDFTQQVSKTTLPQQNTPAQPVVPPTQGRGRHSDKHNKQVQEESDSTWYSIFPVENDELVYGSWEDDVIWDPEAMPKIPEPRILTLDQNDDNIVLGIPDEILHQEISMMNHKKAMAQKDHKEKKDQVKRSRTILSKAGVIAEAEPTSPPLADCLEKHPWNISNDEFYSYKTTPDVALKPNVGNLIQHSTPAVELRQPFFPTYLNLTRLRQFHRRPLRKFRNGEIADSTPHGVEPLVKHIKRRAKQREQERLASGGGEMFFMHTAEDLSGKDGEIVLAECSEEHPPLLNQIGMATKIKNYYRRKLATMEDLDPNKYAYGEPALIHTSPFLGNLHPGESIQTFENNMYRAPLYQHVVPETDFLIIRTRDNYYIRDVETVFTVGQELPIVEVPGPNSKKANNFIRDFLQVYIYRLFWKSQDEPKRIKMEDIKKAFPLHSESSIRKRLKQCADFKRTGMDSNWWVLKSPSEFRLPPEAEIRAMVTPEQCCAYYSMLAAEQRLKDAGYGERSLFAPEDEDDEELQLKMDDEVKAAPWNTTRAFISAMKQKCLLQLSGVADPTGIGEGFSYVRVPNKPQLPREVAIKEPQPKKTVTGTDADLRRLKLSTAKQILRKHGIPEENIKKLARWDIVDLVRTLSTKQARSGEESMSKFARGNRFSIAEHQERYREECQRIFELQNKVLTSIEELSTDEDESDDEEDSDIEEMGKNIESIIANNKTSRDLSFEKEEAERRDFYQNFMLKDESKSKGNKDVEGNMDESSNLATSTDKILNIHRTFVCPDGTEYNRLETVRKPGVIDTYVRIRKTKDADFISQFATSLDEQQREAKRKERRRQQEQMRRNKRNEQHKDTKGGGAELSRQSFYACNDSAPMSPQSFTASRSPSLFLDTKSPPEISISPDDSSQPEVRRRKEKDGSKLRCGACGGIGHMKNNRSCPNHKAPIQVAITQEQLEEEERTQFRESNLVKVDETKLVFNKKLFDQVEENRKRALVLKVPKECLKRRRTQHTEHCDYLQKPEYKQTNRRPTDPLVAMSVIFEDVLKELREAPNTQPFWAAVNPKMVPDYYNVIKNPIDIQKIRKRCQEKYYSSREEFSMDVKQMLTNSETYNGPTHPYTITARQMVELCERRLSERCDKVEALEKAINDND